MYRTNKVHAKKKRLREQYKKLYKELVELLFRHDPIGLNSDDEDENYADEYSLEASTILPRLKDASSPEECRQIIHREFVQWFDADNAGPESLYDEIAKEVWTIWVRHNAEKKLNQ